MTTMIFLCVLGAALAGVAEAGAYDLVTWPLIKDPDPNAGANAKVQADQITLYQYKDFKDKKRIAAIGAQVEQLTDAVECMEEIVKYMQETEPDEANEPETETIYFYTTKYERVKPSAVFTASKNGLLASNKKTVLANCVCKTNNCWSKVDV